MAKKDRKKKPVAIVLENVDYANLQMGCMPSFKRKRRVLRKHMFNKQYTLYLRNAFYAT